MKNLLHTPARLLMLSMLAAAPLFSACSDNDDPTPDEDNEQITTVTYTLTPSSGGAPVTVSYRDLDGDGGSAPVIGSLNLAPNTTYTGVVTLLDETKNPATDISAEVRAEADEHLLVFEPAPANLMTITRTDRDQNNLELGLQTRVVTTGTTTGTLKITLRHQPGAKNGTFAPGSTDVEVVFPTTIR